MIDDGRVNAVLVDIDGVLCDVDYNPECHEDFHWEEFIAADLNRAAIKAGISLVQILVDQGLTPVFLTARPEVMRAQTEKLLTGYNLYGECYMSSNAAAFEENASRDYQLHQMVEKLRIIEEECLTDTYNFVYAIDDQEHNAKMYNEQFGIPTLQARFI